MAISNVGGGDSEGICVHDKAHIQLKRGQFLLQNCQSQLISETDGLVNGSESNWMHSIDLEIDKSK